MGRFMDVFRKVKSVKDCSRTSSYIFMWYFRNNDRILHVFGYLL